MQIPSGKNIIRMNQLHMKVGLSKSLLYALIAKGKFPKGFSLTSGGRAVGWLEQDIDNWILANKEASK